MKTLLAGKKKKNTKNTTVKCEDRCVEKEDRHRSVLCPTKSMIQSPAVTDNHGIGILTRKDNRLCMFLRRLFPCFFVSFAKLLHLAVNVILLRLSLFLIYTSTMIVGYLVYDTSE